MSIRDKIAQQYIDSCLIIDVAECVKADMAQAPKVCWQCGLSFADTILAIEHPTKVINLEVDEDCPYASDADGCNKPLHAGCPDKFSPECCTYDTRPATIADLTRIEK